MTAHSHALRARDVPGSLVGLTWDNRGAVMVVAVFMAAFLVGSLWYVIGIGDAVIYRGRMQDGADAVAFVAAVQHARGMNIIAMINILMAGILGVLVAFKLLQLINTLAMVVSCALSAYNVGNPTTGAVCSLTGALESPIDSSVEVAQELVDAVLPVLSKTQVAVAYAIPWAAEGRAVETGPAHYKKPVTSSGMLSTSLVPNMPEERLGLPVQEDDYAFLCQKAAEGVIALVFQPFGPFAGWVQGVTGGIAASYPDYFCGSGSMSSSSVNGAVKTSVNQECEQQAQSMPKDDRGDFIKECRGKAQKQANQSLNQSNLGGSSGGGLSDTDGKTSKKVFWDAQNGDGYFQIWALALGDESWPKTADKGVEIAAWTQRMPIPSSAWGSLQLAQAEFYYDESGSWDSMKEDAMWNMKWRARLRRVSPPESDVQSVLGSVLGAVTGALDGSLASMLGSPEIGSFVTGDYPEGFEAPFGALLQSGSRWEGSLIKEPMLRNDAAIEIIH